MVNNASLDRTFAALADPTRRAILGRLAAGGATVGELAEPFEMSLPAVSKHVRVLEEAGLVAKRHVGRTVHCSLNGEPMQEAAGWLERYSVFWTLTLDRLEDFLSNEEET